MDFLNINNINLDTIITFLTSAEIQEKLLPIRITFLVFSAFLLVIIIFVLLRTNFMRWSFTQNWVEFFTMRTYGMKKITRQWQEVLRRLDTGVESEYKLAIIEADRMLDNALKRMGYPGVDLEERLGKLNSVILPNIEEIYQAHKSRNNVLHDPDYKLELTEAKRIMNIYDETFRYLQILT